MPAVLKHQRFEDIGSDEMELKRPKRQHLDERDDEEGNGLDKDEGEIEDARYVPPLFVFLSPLLRKVLKRPSDLGKGTMSLNHLICIPKICYSRSANFALDFPNRESLKAQKKSTSCLRKGLESHSASIASIASGATNYRHPIREYLESHLLSNYHQDLATKLCANQRQSFESYQAATPSSSFTNTFDIFKVTPLPTKASAMGQSLWRGHCRRLGIKDSIPAGRSLCLYT